MASPKNLHIALYISCLRAFFTDISVMCTTRQDLSNMFHKSLFLDDLQVCPFSCE